MIFPKVVHHGNQHFNVTEEIHHLKWMLSIWTEDIVTGRMHIRTWLATTASCGSSGSAAANKACSDRRTVLSVIAAALEAKSQNHNCNSERLSSEKSVLLDGEGGGAFILL